MCANNLGQGHSGSGAHPRKTGRDSGIRTGWDASPSQGTMHTHNLFLGGERKPDNPEETYMNIGRCEYVKVHRDSNPNSGSNRNAGALR